ncbi:DUF1707 domain-containing protein [Solwaraspora sp. WMMD792]|uniref:DUF1707 SHOCT-like domain-containing protein n=1 Tax=Solwaraspora sp. WMMD792 TaxID=3016099 RepID=UPI002417630C|nr:DUF1707 domain-containing protein [Solwaraspora sp. WMMD792]MDG4770112.1 DUF1707 domain-containing protein [Solwaraspora sp. WMMD792]
MSDLPDRLPPDRLPPDGLRASDADREQVAEVLRAAAAEGRIDLPELDERLGRVYAARTYAELEPLTRDIPRAVSDAVARRGEHGLAPSRPSQWAIAVMSGFDRRGRWVAPGILRAIAFWGGGRIDLREAQFDANAIRIRAWAIMGGIEIVVPDDAEVSISGIGLMGDFGQRAAGLGSPGGPRIHINGLAFWGGVTVRRRGRPGR